MRFACICFILISLAGCQKVINVNLNNTSTKYVIVGKITDQPGECQVYITRTKNFSEDNQFPGVSGATVTVENNGIVTSLPETGTGVYSTGSLTGKPGQTYALTVHIGNETFSSISTMPQPVNLDSIYVKTGALSNKKYVTVVYKDPPGIANYYHFIQYVNDHMEPTIFVSDDEFTDGRTVKSELNFSNDTNNSARDIKSGDSVRIEMICNDSAVYKYWYTLYNGATGASQSASPSNPVSNISGGVMGYFSAQTVQWKGIRVE
ncbi:MAG: DUF4249 domain-containing protein [Chitinophagaceae bacterium]|nr:DUF4249 domain-containing protein [Chitinophagaceae bacterium]